MISTDKTEIRLWQKLVLIVLLLFSLQSTPAQAGTCLTFIAQENGITEEIANNFSRALNASDICHKIEYFPEKRADYLFSNKKYDGFVARVAEFEKHSRVDVEKVEPSLVRSTGVLVSRSSKIKSIADLNGNTLGIIRGWLWMENLSKNHKTIVIAPTILGLVEMFHKENVDAILMPKETLFAFGLDNYPSNSIADLQLYIFMKTRPGNLNTNISNAIKEYVKAGNSFFRNPINE